MYMVYTYMELCKQFINRLIKLSKFLENNVIVFIANKLFTLR